MGRSVRRQQPARTERKKMDRTDFNVSLFASGWRVVSFFEIGKGLEVGPGKMHVGRKLLVSLSHPRRNVLW